MARRAGRPRKANAVRRNQHRRREAMGPTPERARQVLAAVGLLDLAAAFGGALVARFDGAGRPLADDAHRALLRAADEARAADEDVLRLWWQHKVGGEGIPLDRLHLMGAIDRRQHMAGMRYARAAWRLIGLPWPNVEAIYRRTGAVPDERAGVMRADPERDERAEESAEADLAVSARAIRVRCGEVGLRLLGGVAIYLEDRWVGSTAFEREQNREWVLLLRALDAAADALRIRA